MGLKDKKTKESKNPRYEGLGKVKWPNRVLTLCCLIVYRGKTGLPYRAEFAYHLLTDDEEGFSLERIQKSLSEKHWYENLEEVRVYLAGSHIATYEIDNVVVKTADWKKTFEVPTP